VIGLDTNVLVRYIVEDEPAQAELARIVIEEKCNASAPGFINLIVLCELVWVLQRAYRCQRHLIAEVLRNLFLTEVFLIEKHDVAWQAYLDYCESNCDYADCLISRLNSSFDCSTTLTFDRKAGILPGNTLLQSK